jgi:hypothetical protein
VKAADRGESSTRLIMDGIGEMVMAKWRHGTRSA